MPSISVPRADRPLLAALAREAERRGLPLYAVGGCVRDWRLGRRTFDLDLVCEGDPAELAGLCARRLGGRPEAFGAFGTLRVTGGRLRVDFASSRRETYPEPAALPVVEAPVPLAEDLKRRDFTVNAMALRLSPAGTGELYDPLGGLKDLERGVLRLLHPGSLRDDPTRVFRAARYLCRLGLKAADGFDALAREALRRGWARRLSRHRLLQELWRVLAEERPAAPLRLLRSWGYLDLVFPRLRDPRAALEEPEERLASMALALGPARGRELLASLPIERGAAARVSEPLRLASERLSGPKAPTPAARRVLKAHVPRLPAPALRAAFLRGTDLEAAGVPPGKALGDLLREAGRLQWRGELRSRRQALAWLKRRQSP